MPWLIVVLRLVHIVSGVFWAGSTFAFAGFVEPTARAKGPEGGRFLQALAGSSGYPQAMMVAGLLTLGAGVWLLWHDSAGFQREFMASGMGITLSVGMLAGILAAVVGIAVAARNAMRLARVAQAVQAHGGAPTPEEAAEMQALLKRLRIGGRFAAACLAVAVAAMAVARYATS